uniref:Uncharacterized protein n=1 Tax=Salmo trutta TaxID=8032 RepID=A0A674C2T5_SALTR
SQYTHKIHNDKSAQDLRLGRRFTFQQDNDHSTQPRQLRSVKYWTGRLAVLPNSLKRHSRLMVDKNIQFSGNSSGVS